MSDIGNKRLRLRQYDGVTIGDSIDIVVTRINSGRINIKIAAPRSDIIELRERDKNPIGWVKEKQENGAREKSG